ncbi:hypothetical protein RSAG8_10723, partial [Rhizoctonia solani AG-8 WAC10335]
MSSIQAWGRVKLHSCTIPRRR